MKSARNERELENSSRSSWLSSRRLAVFSAQLVVLNTRDTSSIMVFNA